jgi:AcrR family transcriptional regulator
MLNELAFYSTFNRLMTRINQHTIEQKPETAEVIVDAAERLLHSYGYQKMTMTDLAAEAGIGVGTTYLHFASKADVAVAVAERVHKRMLHGLQQLAGSGDEVSLMLAKMLWYRIELPYEFVRKRLVTMSWQQFTRHGSQFIDDIRSSDPGKVEKWSSNEQAVFAQVIAAGTEASVFTTVDPQQTAKTLLVATCGFMPKNLEQSDFSDREVFECKVKSVIQLLINGISNDTTRSSIKHQTESIK